MRHTRLFAVTAGAIALASLSLTSGPAAEASSAASGAPGLLRACATPAKGFAACNAIMRTSPNAAGTAPTGYGPADIQAAYGLSGLKSGGRTVAIVDAYGYSAAEADLQVFRNYYGLPACTTANGCFKKVDQKGGTAYPRQNAGWDHEQALDLDAVSSACPDCKIVLVQAKSAGFADLGAAVNQAAKMGVTSISNSYGGSDSSDTTYGSYYNHPGIAVTASTGDSGYQSGGQYPAGSRYVVAVGGTSLTRSGTTFTEKAWSGAGSGCSTLNVAVAPTSANTGCAKRASADVSAVADPATGLSIYVSVSYQGYSGWVTYGGTSLSSPLVAAMYGLKGVSGNYPTSNIYASLGTSAFHDVTAGSNGTCPTTQWCNSGTGWDGPTGVGSPSGLGGL